MTQIKIIKSKHVYNDYYDDVGRSVITAGSTWLEVDQAEANKLNDAIGWANRNEKDGWHYSLVYNIDRNEFDDIFTSAQQAIDKYEKEKLKYEKAAADAKVKKEATALLRKQKQLAKLKRELGEEKD
jgi:hypothetical protein